MPSSPEPDGAVGLAAVEVVDEEGLHLHGLTQVQMASLTGLHQNRLSNCKTGKHEPEEYSVFAAFADGLGLPATARQDCRSTQLQATSDLRTYG